MDNSFEEDIAKRSQLLRATFIFQWIFSIIGINLPPCLNLNLRLTRKQLNLLWFVFIIYTVILIALVSWIVYVNNVVVDVVVYNYDLDSITSVLSISVNITVAIVQVMAQLMAFLKFNCLTVMYKRIAQLEQDILLYIRQYQWLRDDGLEMDYQKKCQQFSRQILIRFGLFSFAFGVFMCYVNYYLVADIMSLKDKLLTIISALALQMKSIEYCIITQIIDVFLGTLHSSLTHLKCEIVKNERKLSMTSFYNGKLMANQCLLNRVWLLVTNIEEYFSIPMLILYLYNGIAITHTINWSYVRSFDYNESDCCQAFRIYYITLTFVIMLLPCWLTQSCIDKYNQFGPILHNIKTDDYFDSALSLRLREYSLQLQHQRMLFTCSGFFDINLKYFGMMILSISTYVAILIQFKLQMETEKANIRL